MKFASMEFVAFDSADVIATSGEPGTFFFRPLNMNPTGYTRNSSTLGFFIDGVNTIYVRYADGTELSEDDWYFTTYFTLVPSANNFVDRIGNIYVCTEVGSSAPAGATEYKDFADILNWVKNINQ